MANLYIPRRSRVHGNVGVGVQLSKLSKNIYCESGPCQIERNTIDTVRKCY
jgi:hypothetical protein